MRHVKNRDVWIGVIVLALLTVLGVAWLMLVNEPTFAMSDTATSTPSTKTQSTTNVTTAVQQPDTIKRTAQTVISIAENLSGAGEFASLLSESGVASKLNGAGPYTIFVPTNNAFSALPPGTISSLSAAGKQRLVEYHIVFGRAIDVTAEFSGSIQALSGDELNFSDGAAHVPMVNSAILITAYKASNGVVYLIDNVLIPPISTQNQI
ncbi:MAG TPA: fasciclin domain-containing protein [Candidatus Paceibacterota bacterium]|nr:fasciclin domain-containing protein [Candidatus Paceibacterota bacterium]